MINISFIFYLSRPAWCFPHLSKQNGSSRYIESMEWSPLESRNCFELLSWKVDVEWCGFFSEAQTPPTNAPTDIDWEALAAGLGLVGEVPSTCSDTPSSYVPVKVTGVVLLLGLSSYLCYKLYRVWLYQQYRSGRRHNGRDTGAPPGPTPFSAEDTPALSYHHLSNPQATISDLLNVKTRYFGPLHFNNDDNCSENEMIQCQDNSTSSESRWWRVGERRKKRRLVSPPSASSSGHRRGWLLHRLQALAPGSVYNTQSSNGAGSNSTGNSSTDSSPLSYSRHYSSLSRDLSFDCDLSLGMVPRRQGSVDSMSSELSFDMPSFTEQTTVARLDRLQEEIDQLKSNCQLMDEEFETVKCNRNMPGLSDLMEAAEQQDKELDTERQLAARACFTGLYSLTTINRSMSMDLSAEEDSPQVSGQFGTMQLVEEGLPSLEWDEDYGGEQRNDCTWAEDTANGNSYSVCAPPTPVSPDLSSKLDTSGYGSKMDISGSMSGSQFSCFESPSSPAEELRDAVNTELLRSMSCDSELSVTSPMLDNPPTHRLSVSPRTHILPYAHLEWTGNTPTARTMLRGYQEAAEKLNYRFLRQIRGDNYCAVRGAIFQYLAQGLPAPSGTQALMRLSQAHNIGAKWRFHGLPYNGGNVLRGVQICLHTLDNVSALLVNGERSKCSVEEREEMLSRLMNTDPSMDYHLMEAVKLHMMSTALDLHEALARGHDVPLFAILMFARDTSEVPLDFMNNHLAMVGDSGGLEQVEMCLLGYTLGTVIRVIRPSAHGSEQFVCHYPDPDDFVAAHSWPRLSLLAEDDRHYNVIC